MKRKLTTVLTVALAAGMMMTGCGSSNSGTETKESATTAAADSTAADTTAAAAKSGEVTTIRFYGSDSEYNQNIVAGFQAENPDIKVEIVPVDFDNAEQVIKTGYCLRRSGRRKLLLGQPDQCLYRGQHGV